MQRRYEVKDLHHPQWKGMRFSSKDRAVKTAHDGHPRGRFRAWDRLEKRWVS